MRLTSTSARPFLARLLLLGGLAFLGLYVYGLVMSAFDPLEIVGFTVLAMGVIAAYAVHVFRLKRSCTTRSSVMS